MHYLKTDRSSLSIPGPELLLNLLDVGQMGIDFFEYFIEIGRYGGIGTVGAPKFPHLQIQMVKFLFPFLKIVSIMTIEEFFSFEARKDHDLCQTIEICNPFWFHARYMFGYGPGL